MTKEDNKKYQKLTKEYHKISYYCKCGHTIVIPETNKKGYAICKWCGRKVKKDNKNNLETIKTIETLKRFWQKKELEK